MSDQRALQLLAVLLLATGGVLTGCDDPVGPMGARPKATPSPTTNTGSNAVDPSLGWTRVPPSPLSPRQGAGAVAVDGEALVLGGRAWPVCQPAEACARPDEPALTDSAAYDPADQRWRRLADAPLPLANPRGVALDGVVYLLVSGARADEPSRFLAYDVRHDRWDVLPSPAADVEGLQLVVLGDRIVAIRRSHAQGAAADRVYDPEDRSWTSLPLAPTAPTDDRAAVTADGELVVLGEPRDHPSGDEPDALVMAAYEPDTATWRKISDPPAVGAVTSWGSAWSAIDELIGADPGRGGSSPLPAPMPTPRRGGLGEPHTTWVNASPAAILTHGWLLRPGADNLWTPVPANPALPDADHATVLLGQRLLVWGGGAWSGDRPLSAQGWMWTPATG